MIGDNERNENVNDEQEECREYHDGVIESIVTWYDDGVIENIVTWYDVIGYSQTTVYDIIGRTDAEYRRRIEQTMMDATGQMGINAIEHLVAARPDDCYTRKIPRLLHTILCDIKRTIGGDSFNDHCLFVGLCCNIYHHSSMSDFCYEHNVDYDKIASIITRGFRVLQVDWPEYSGDRIFPVPSPNPDESAENAYTDCTNKYEGEYGAARIRLLDYLISRLEGNL